MHTIDPPEPTPVPLRPRSSRPSVPPIWAAFLGGLRAKGLAPDGQLVAMERAGAAPEVLAALVVQLYYPEPMWLRGCIRQDNEEEFTAEEKLARSSWAVRFLADPEPVVAVFGHSLMNVFAFRVACLHPSCWLDGRVHLGLEPEVILGSIERGFLFLSPIAPLDLTWMQTVQGSLEIRDPIWPLHLPVGLRCRDRLHLRGALGVVTLRGYIVEGEASTALIENCPDLTDLELPRAMTVEVRNCPALRRIWGRAPEGDLRVEGCPQLQQAVLTFPKDTLSRLNITFRDCPALVRLESTGRARRAIGDLTVAGCPSLQPPLQPLVVMGRLSVPDHLLPAHSEGHEDPQESR